MPTFGRCTPARRARLVALITASSALIGPGCGQPSPAEPEGARVVLEQTLDAWRDGQSSNNPTGPASGVRIGEPMWEGGYQLVGYEIGQETRPAGFDVQFTVALSMRDPQGKPVDETVHYIVSMHPARTVIRSAF